jgi:dCMP deaminase
MSNIVLSWDDYFMGVALLSTYRSKDPNSGSGACIVNPQNRIVGVGYNGFPTGCADVDLPWSQTGEYMDTKYPYVVHAEINAILNSNGDLNGCRLYNVLFPCNECAKAIIQSGIRELIYLNYNRSPESDIFIVARKLFDLAGVKYRRLEPQINEFSLDFTCKPIPENKAEGYYPTEKTVEG